MADSPHPPRPGTDPRLARIDAVPLGATPAPAGTVEPLPGGRLAVRTREVVEVHARDAFLSGAREPLSRLHLPPRTRAAVAPDGGFVLAEGAALAARTADGAPRWRLPHDGWHGGHTPPRPPGAPAVSPCGTWVAAVVPHRLADGEPGEVAVHDGPPRVRYGQDRLLLIDAATGEVRARRPVAALSGAVTLRWHPDGTVFTASCWTPWYSWTTYWCDTAGRTLGGTAYHEAVGFLPGTARTLTLRRAEHLLPDDDQYELAWHDVHDPTRTAALDLTTLSWHPEEDDYDDAHPLGPAHVLVTSDWLPREGPLTPSHWLHDADTLHPLGRLRYPVPTTNPVTALGDGTWLTRDGGVLRRWGVG
ncbi:hypothetical protein GCM10027168_06210 [Streptomyces capparidis]